MANLIFKKVNFESFFWSFFDGNSSIIFNQSYFWYLAQVIPSWGESWDIWKIIYSRWTKFLVVAHMDFLTVAYKNEPQDLWKLLCKRLKSEWKYSRKYFNCYYEKNCQKKFYFLYLWVRLSTVHFMLWFWQNQWAMTWKPYSSFHVKSHAVEN